MKFTHVIFTTLLAVASVEGAAVANSGPTGGAWHGYCYRAGETCSKLKRAAEAAAEAIAGPPSCDASCGEACLKVKRDALALAEATAEAYAVADPEASPCHAPGGSCSIAKRQALDACDEDPLVKRTPVRGSWHGYCYLAGETCSKLKRAAEAVAEAIAQPNQDPEAESESLNLSCSPAGDQCSNQKRAIDDVNSLLDKILLR